MREAYFQLRSDTMRLAATGAALAAREGLWVFQPQASGYHFDERHLRSWSSLEDSAELRRVRELIGPKRPS
jgi:hypothetical protein